MSYLIEPFVTVARANLQLALRLAEIGRAQSSDWTAASNRVAHSIFDQMAALKPGVLPATAKTDLPAVMDTLRSMGASRTTEIRAALETWQAAWQEAASMPAMPNLVAGPDQVANAPVGAEKPASPPAKTRTPA